MVSRKEEKEEVRNMMENLWDACYALDYGADVPELEINSLQKRSNKYAHINYREWIHTILIALDWSDWERASRERKMTILLHEISHVEHSNHKKVFWEEYIENYHSAREVPEIFGQTYDWNEIGTLIVKDVNPSNIDGRQMDTGPWRAEVADRLGVEDVDDRYSRNPVEAKMDDKTLSYSNGYGTEWINFNEVERTHDVTGEEAYQYFKENSSKVAGRHIINKPQFIEQPDGTLIPYDLEAEYVTVLKEMSTGSDKFRGEIRREA